MAPHVCTCVLNDCVNEGWMDRVTKMKVKFGHTIFKRQSNFISLYDLYLKEMHLLVVTIFSSE
jgi:hypothetical protein